MEQQGPGPVFSRAATAEGEVVVASRNIAAGDEPVVDYAVTGDDHSEMRRQCGTASRRGTVTGKDRPALAILEQPLRSLFTGDPKQ